jgi:hypothetical protein
MRVRVSRTTKLCFVIACVLGAANWACNGWDPRDPFQHEAPDVDRAIKNLDAGKPESAEKLLTQYLDLGACADGGIALSPEARSKQNGVFDLGLTIFQLAERFGLQFGEEEDGDGGASEKDEARLRQRSVEIDCALSIVDAISGDRALPAELRARAHYLAGNLEFLRRNYLGAIGRYDEALAIVPAIQEEAGGDSLGRDAAHNRAIAVRRLQWEEGGAGDGGGEDGISKSSKPQDGDGGDGGKQDSDAGDGGGNNGDAGDAGPDASDGGRDSGSDAGDGGDGKPDAGRDGGDDKRDQPQPVDPDDSSRKDRKMSPAEEGRLLDQLDRARTYQQEDARRHARRRPSAEDK